MRQFTCSNGLRLSTKAKSLRRYLTMLRSQIKKKVPCVIKMNFKKSNLMEKVPLGNGPLDPIRIFRKPHLLILSLPNWIFSGLQRFMIRKLLLRGGDLKYFVNLLSQCLLVWCFFFVKGHPCNLFQLFWIIKEMEVAFFVADEIWIFFNLMENSLFQFFILKNFLLISSH